MHRLDQAMVDAGDGAGVFEGMRPERLFAFDPLPDLGRAPGFAAGGGEVGAVVGQHSMDLSDGPRGA
jgi:hypothetical protein